MFSLRLLALNKFLQNCFFFGNSMVLINLYHDIQPNNKIHLSVRKKLVYLNSFTRLHIKLQKKKISFNLKLLRGIQMS